MKNVVFLGSKEIGLECLKVLFSQSKVLQFKVIGVLTNIRGESIVNYCRTNRIPIIKSLEEYMELSSVDIAISVQYHQLLKNIHINKAKEITVNLHMAPLPEYRGCNQFSFAIIEGKREFGTTIHKMEEGIDSGGIIAERRFAIEENIWVEDLYNKTFEQSVLLFKETLPHLINKSYTLKPQNSYLSFRTTSLHYRKEILKLKEIDLSWDKDKIERHIRGLYMPGFEPPFAIIDGKKVYFKKEND